MKSLQGSGRIFLRFIICTGLIIYTVLLTHCLDYSIHETPLQMEYVPPLQKLTTRAEILAAVTGTTYYLAETGNDESNDGSSGHPWRSLAKVQSVLKDGDAVCLRAGNYGTYNDLTPRTKWVTYYRETESTEVTFNNIVLRGPNIAGYTSLKVRFWGILFAPKAVDPPAADPQNDDPADYLTEHPVNLLHMRDIQFYHCTSYGGNKHLTDSGYNLEQSSHIRIERCYIHTVTSGITYVGVKHSQYYYNRIEGINGSFVKDGSGSSNIVIEGNYGTNSNWNTNEDYSPELDAPATWYHGSFVSIRSSNMIIRNNIFHDGCNSSGMMLYGEQGVHYNILIENNLLYDPHSNYVMRIYNLGTNIVIRNNIFVGRQRYVDGAPTPSGSRQYNTALALHEVASGYTAKGLHVYNNILVGTLSLGGWHGQVNETGNIFWSVIDINGNELGDKDVDPGSVVISENDEKPVYFESGFFNGTFRCDWTDITDETSSYFPNPEGHHQFIDFSYAPGCDAINFGDPGKVPENSLGSVVDGFIQLDGPPRNIDHHSAGCYEVN